MCGRGCCILAVRHFFCAANCWRTTTLQADVARTTLWRHPKYRAPYFMSVPLFQREFPRRRHHPKQKSPLGRFQHPLPHHPRGFHHAGLARTRRPQKQQVPYRTPRRIQPCAKYPGTGPPLPAPLHPAPLSCVAAPPQNPGIHCSAASDSTIYQVEAFIRIPAATLDSVCKRHIGRIAQNGRPGAKSGHSGRFQVPANQ